MPLPQILWNYQYRPKDLPNGGAEIMADQRELVRCDKDTEVCIGAFFCPCMQFAANEKDMVSLIKAWLLL